MREPPGRASRLILLMLLVGTAGRLVLAFKTYGNSVDIANSKWAIDALRDGSPWDFYAEMEGVARWPYLVGFAPWLLVADELAERFGRFDGWLQVAPILADAAIAWVVAMALRARGATARTRVLAVALIAFGPPFFVISGFSYQIDSVAVLPGLIGLVIWERGAPGRALWCGLLAGLAVAVKPPLAIAVLAMLPTVRTPREAAALLAWAAAIPALLLAPFLLAEPAATMGIFGGYSGLSGQVGLTAVLQPDLMKIWLQTGDFDRYDPLLADVGGLVNLAVLAAGTAYAARRRLGALDAAALIAALLWAFGAGMSFSYLIWGLPFMLAGGRIALVAALSALYTPLLAAVVAGRVDDLALRLYQADAYLLWVLLCASVVIIARSPPAAGFSRARARGGRVPRLDPPSP